MERLSVLLLVISAIVYVATGAAAFQDNFRNNKILSTLAYTVALISVFSLFIEDNKPVKREPEDVSIRISPPLPGPSAGEQARRADQIKQQEADKARRQKEEDFLRAKLEEERKKKEEAQRIYEVNAKVIRQKLNELPVPQPSRQLNR